jgi:hypothetical protein
MDHSIASTDKDFVLAAEEAGDAAKLPEVVADGVIRKVSWNSCEADIGDSVARCPAVD